MPTTVYKLVRQSSRAPDLDVSDFAWVTALSLAGLVLILAMIYLGLDLDYGAGILG